MPLGVDFRLLLVATWLTLIFAAMVSWRIRLSLTHLFLPPARRRPCSACSAPSPPPPRPRLDKPDAPFIQAPRFDLSSRELDISCGDCAAVSADAAYTS
jgi:hypothetical protein